MEFIPAPDSSGSRSFVVPQEVWILLAIFAALIVVFSIMQMRRNRAMLRREWQEQDAARGGASSAAPQSLEISTDLTFVVTPIVGKKALEVMNIFENVIWDINAGFTVLLCCNLDSFLSVERGGDAATQQRALRLFQSEVLDYLVINAEGLPVLGAIYYTEGPTGNPRKPGDAATQTIQGVLHQAGIRFFEIEPGFRPRDLIKRLKKTLKSSIL